MAEDFFVEALLAEDVFVDVFFLFVEEDFLLDVLFFTPEERLDVPRLGPPLLKFVSAKAVLVSRSLDAKDGPTTSSEVLCELLPEDLAGGLVVIRTRSESSEANLRLAIFLKKFTTEGLGCHST